MDVSKLIGKQFTSIEKKAEDEIFFTDSEGEAYRMYHDQDCCENVSIEDITGDLKDLIGYPILMAEEVCNSDNPKQWMESDEDEPNGYFDESHTWTFYKFATIKGYVTIRWYGSSNGYYSERVSLVKESSKDEYGYYEEEE